MDQEFSVFERIYAATCQIPHGKVASYGAVAAAAGLPGRARVAGWALAKLPPDTEVPWQRVVNRLGVLTIINLAHTDTEQKDRLEAEGVEVAEKEGVFQVVSPPWHNFKEGRG